MEIKKVLFSDAIKTVNNRADVRCILDGPDFTPWWVKTDAASCKGKDINRLEQEHFLWGKVADQSCVKASAGNTSEIFHQCDSVHASHLQVHLSMNLFRL